MCDMYPWDRAAALEETAQDPALALAARAVQVALGRRDNGGATAAPTAR